ncbi:helix-turn-helix domain-containing protein [Mesorhizobium sp. ESP-6-2]|uniref:helix-turn-helix domain-containing protein n=1 Tax=Mesorhizobium sp. ESP-6-2 TaxID=2876625 RepID=UPI001CD037DF|nr:helix-turn-helix domain-containing protein [Mesorhizobium sp. ESP-6-2]MBZ9807675.1 hypothetical protein [Mesorhizobium sp. ESP-6-2]
MQVYSYRATERGIRERQTVRQMPVSGEIVESAQIIRSARLKAKAEAEKIINEARSYAAELIAEAIAMKEEAEARAGKVLGAAGLRSDDMVNRTPAADLIKSVADKHCITVDDIKGYGRSDVITAIRFEAIALVYSERPDLSLPQIARIFNRDHTSILHAVEKAGVYRPTRARRDDAMAKEGCAMGQG